MQRLPSAPPLRRFVSTVWATGATPPASLAPREHVLPTGAMHLVFRLSGPPLRLFRDSTDGVGSTLGHAIVGGARSAFYARDVSVPTRSVGAQLRPGAATVLFGVPADALAGQHTPLDALWGREAALALERLHAAATPMRQLDVLEALLLAKLSAAPAVHPAVAQALRQLEDGAQVRSVVEASGYSHRSLIALFREATGLAPKTYGRVVRFQRVLKRLERQPSLPWTELALEAGYSDQAHLGREFTAIAGITPQAWRRAGPASANHVPVPR